MDVDAKCLLTSLMRGPSAIAELPLNLGAPFISQESLKLELSDIVHRETILIIAKGMTNHSQTGRGWAHMTILHVQLWT